MKRSKDGLCGVSARGKKKRPKSRQIRGHLTTGGGYAQPRLSSLTGGCSRTHLEDVSHTSGEEGEREEQKLLFSKMVLTEEKKKDSPLAAFGKGNHSEIFHQREATTERTVRGNSSSDQARSDRKNQVSTRHLRVVLGGSRGQQVRGEGKTRGFIGVGGGKTNGQNGKKNHAGDP